MQAAPRRFRVSKENDPAIPNQSAASATIPLRAYLSRLNVKLTPRETEVTTWIACGKTYPEIAILLSISERTAKAHLESACHKLNATNKAHAIAIALVNELIKF